MFIIYASTFRSMIHYIHACTYTYSCLGTKCWCHFFLFTVSNHGMNTFWSIQAATFRTALGWSPLHIVYQRAVSRDNFQEIMVVAHWSFPQTMGHQLGPKKWYVVI